MTGSAKCDSHGMTIAARITEREHAIHIVAEGMPFIIREGLASGSVSAQRNSARVRKSSQQKSPCNGRALGDRLTNEQKLPLANLDHIAPVGHLLRPDCKLAFDLWLQGFTANSYPNCARTLPHMPIAASSHRCRQETRVSRRPVPPKSHFLNRCPPTGHSPSAASLVRYVTTLSISLPLKAMHE